jgi:3-dehydroquinate synthase
LVLTDSGVPAFYAQKVLEKSYEGYLYIINQGEESKSFENFGLILDYLVEKEFSRTDCIVALGGGVVGDLAGFVASTYMRGIDFYNIPTTLLSQVDSSIGGKTAIDKKGIKNVVGAFYPPKKVVIDPEVLKTLDTRQLHSGLVEAIKMAITSNEELFKLIENSSDLLMDIDEIIYQSLLIKKEVVEIDPKETGLRKILNFGHTIGHAIEATSTYLHGESVGLGMLYMTNSEVKKRLLKVLEKYKLPTKIENDSEELFKYISLDKKRSGNNLTIIYVEKLGTYEIRKILLEDIRKYL